MKSDTQLLQFVLKWISKITSCQLTTFSLSYIRKKLLRPWSLEAQKKLEQKYVNLGGFLHCHFFPIIGKKSLHFAKGTFFFLFLQFLQVERERWRTSSQNGQYLMPSASTGNIPRQFRSLQGKLLFWFVLQWSRFLRETVFICIYLPKATKK